MRWIREGGVALDMSMFALEKGVFALEKEGALLLQRNTPSLTQTRPSLPPPGWAGGARGCDSGDPAAAGGAAQQDAGRAGGCQVGRALREPSRRAGALCQPRPKPHTRLCTSPSVPLRALHAHLSLTFTWRVNPRELGWAGGCVYVVWMAPHVEMSRSGGAGPAPLPQRICAQCEETN